MSDDRLRATGARRRERQAREGLAGSLHQGGLHAQVPIEIEVMRAQLANDSLNPNIRALLIEVLQEVDGFEQKVVQLDRALAALSESDPVLVKLESLPGIGWVNDDRLHATGVRRHERQAKDGLAGVLHQGGLLAAPTNDAMSDIHRFKDSRSLSSWIGFTPKESSSGSTRTLGRMSKRGDVYVRTLLIQGARSVRAAARRKQQSGKPLDALRQWAITLADRRGFNKAAVGLANKLARIVWATWKHDRAFDGNHALGKSLQPA